MVAGAGIAPAFAPSKGAVLLLDDPASKGDGLMDWWISGLVTESYRGFPWVSVRLPTVAAMRRESVERESVGGRSMRWWMDIIFFGLNHLESP